MNNLAGYIQRGHAYSMAKPDKPCKPPQDDVELVELTRAILGKLQQILAAIRDSTLLHEKLDQIMSAISDHDAAVKASFDAIEAAQTKLETALTGVSDDVTYLKEVIDKLQTNPGTITPEDQALLDAAQARVKGLSDRLTSVATAMENLDAATVRPTPPPTP